jgi:hypothetical protein
MATDAQVAKIQAERVGLGWSGVDERKTSETGVVGERNKG